MRQESEEKKIIETLQQYTSPEPDPAFEARLKAKFLQEAIEVKRKRKFFRGIAWSGTIVASLLVGVLVSQGNLISWINNQVNQQEVPDQALRPPVTMPSDQWEPIDTNQLELMDSDYLGNHNLALYTTPDKTKLYAVLDGNGVLLYETQATQIMAARSYPFPNQQSQFYVWFMEDQELVKDQQVKRTDHFYLLKQDGTFSEIKDIPQPGYNTSHTLEWSPSGNAAYLAMESQEEWVVGQLMEDDLTFKPLYGQITRQSTEVNLELPEQSLNWEVAWVNDEELLVYNPGSHSFYGVNPENQSAWEYKVGLPEFSQGQYVKKITVPLNQESRVAIISVGAKVFDVSFHGTERLYALHLDREEFVPIDNLMVKSNARFFDQYHFGGMKEGQEQLIGSVTTSDQKGFGLRFGPYDLQSNQYTALYERNFNEPIALDNEAKFSLDGKWAAFRVHSFPPDAVGKMYLCVVDIKTGQEVIEPIERKFISSYEFQQDGTLKIDDQLIPLKK